MAYRARDIDTTVPSAARVYDALLGGTHHYPVDEIFLTRLLETMPVARTVARANRAWLRRAVRFMQSRGIRQYIDLGSGIPTSPNVHEIDPDARVVYADSDGEAVVTAEDVVGGIPPRAIAIQADIRLPETVFGNDAVVELLNPGEPVGLVLAAVLHFVPPQDDPAGIVSAYLDRVAPGSFLAASHITVDDVSDEIRAQGAEAARMYGETASPVTVRTRDEFAALLSGLQLVEPGVSYVEDWRPDAIVDRTDPARPCQYAAVGFKPD